MAKLQLDLHDEERKQARAAGYEDGKQCKYEPSRVDCPCAQCKIAYLDGYSVAFRERKDK